MPNMTAAGPLPLRSPERACSRITSAVHNAVAPAIATQLPARCAAPVGSACAPGFVEIARIASSSREGREKAAVVRHLALLRVTVPRLLGCRVGDALPELGIGQEAGDLARGGFGVAGRIQQAGLTVADDLGRAARSGSDNRHAGRHRLDE